MKKIVLMWVVLPLLSYACPFMIKNDTKGDVIVSNCDGKAIYLKPGKSRVIDPTIRGNILWFIPRRWIKTEKLCVYHETSNPDHFHLKYHLTEKFCESDSEKNKLLISDIVSPLPENMKNRFTIEKHRCMGHADAPVHVH